MPTIIFTAGAKGGTGKSTATRFLITYLRENGFNPMLFDMDDESKTLSRFFPEAQKVRIVESFSHDVLIDNILAGENLIIADLKGGTGMDTLDWWLNLPFDELTDIRFICIGAITSSPDSVQSFMNWAAGLKDRVSYVVFKNQKDGDDFPDYDRTEEAIAFRAKFKPVHVVIPRLHAQYLTDLERLNLTIDEVLEANGSEVINGKKISPDLTRLLVRARLRRFQYEIYDQLNPVMELLN
jgi:MinD-like ATPase involved in chromosome partitioning or flagellar assembly